MNNELTKFEKIFYYGIPVIVTTFLFSNLLCTSNCGKSVYSSLAAGSFAK